MNKKNVLALSLGLALTGIVNAADKSAVIDIPYTKFKLDNGLTVLVHEDHKAPIVAVNVWYHVGSKDEKMGKTGFAHLFEHLMFNGSEHFNDEYFKPFEKVGATDMNGTTSLDRTNYFENVPTTALDMALWMESDRMGHMVGAIDQAKLDEQRGVVQNEKRQGENQPYGGTEEQIQKAVFPAGHPYSWTTIGSMDDLNAAKLDDVHEWFKNYYGAANAVVVLAGDIDVATAKEKMQKYFADIPAGEPLSRRESWVAERHENTRDTMYDQVPQTRIIKTWNAPEFGTLGADQLDIVAALLGSGKNSRLYKTLVFDRQLATSVSVSNQSYELASLFQIQVDVKPGADAHEVERIVDSELQRFQAKGPDAAEIARVKTSLEAAFIRGVERIGGFGGKSDVLATYETYVGDAGAYKQSLQHYHDVTGPQLQAAANRWLGNGVYTLEVVPFGQYKTAASTVDRSKVPETLTTPDLVFPKLQHGKLANGLNIVLAERHTIPTIHFSMQIESGYAADQGEKLGTASYAMAMLDDGTTSLNALQISEKLDQLGANFGAACGLDTCSVGIDALVKNLDPSLQLYTDLLLHPAFAQKDMDRLRGQWLAGIAQEKAQPDSIALRLLPPLMYGPGHAYAIPFTGSGTEKAINALMPADLHAFHKKWLRPDNATLIVVGDTTMTAIMPKLEKIFASWKAPSTAKPQKNVAVVALPAKPRVFLVDKPGAQQSVILAGQVISAGNAPNNFSIKTMNNILGSGFTSRINMNLREDKHWSYGAGMRLSEAAGQRPYYLSAPVQTDKTVESILEARKEINQFLTSKPATADELQKVVMRTTRSLPGRFETAAAVKDSVADIVRFARADNYVETLKTSYESVTLDQVNAAARETLKPEQLTWVIVGDLSKIEKGVRDLNLGELTVIDTDGNKVR